MRVEGLGFPFEDLGFRVRILLLDGRVLQVFVCSFQFYVVFKKAFSNHLALGCCQPALWTRNNYPAWTHRAEQTVSGIALV